MRTSRSIALLATAAITLLIAGAVPGAKAAEAVAAPSAPFDALTINGAAGSWLLESGEYSFDSSNATITGSYAGPPKVRITVRSLDFTHFWGASVSPPTGTTFTLETVYPTARFADASHAGLDVSGDGHGCNGASGWVVVHELTEDPITHALTSFAATYSENCEGYMPAVTGELRWHSSVDYKAIVTNPRSLNFGDVAVEHDSAPRTLTITGKGSQPVMLGAASLTGAGAGSFVITTDGCNGAGLAYADTCTVVITAHPSGYGTTQANLAIPDDTVATHRLLALSVTGVSPTSATISPTQLSFGAVPVGHPSAPLTVTITSTGVDPLSFGQATIGGSTPQVFSITDDSCSNATLNTAQTCTVTVTAQPTGVGTQIATLILPFAASQLQVPLTVAGTNPTSVLVSPASLSFGTIQLEQASAPQTVTVTSIGVDPITFGATEIIGGAPENFTITVDACFGATLANGDTCTMTVIATPQQQGLHEAVLTLPYPSQFVTVPLSVTGGPDPIGTYYPVSPARIMDTRVGLGAAKAPIGPGGVVHLQVAGRGGVPASGASAVVLNVTVTGPTAASYLTIYPTGVTRPGASSLNFVKSWTGANSVTVSLGMNGKIDIYNSKGYAQVIVDVAGYYGGSRSLIAGPGMGGEYQPAVIDRMVDTRSWGYGPVPPGYSILLPVDFGSEVNPHIRALAVNITAVSPTNGGYLTAWNGADTRPGSSTLNFPTGAKAVPNLAIVPVASCTASPSCAGLPQIGIYNGSVGSTHVLVDIFGIFDDGALGFGLRFQPLAPTRIVDSRTYLGSIGKLGPDIEVSILAPLPIADANTVVLALNVTAVNPTAATYLTVWPTGSRPTVSNLNAAEGQIVPNAVLGELDISNHFKVYNYNGWMHLLVDVVGTFVFGPDYFAGMAAGTGTTGSRPHPGPRRHNLHMNPHVTYLDQPWLPPK